MVEFAWWILTKVERLGTLARVAVTTVADTTTNAACPPLSLTIPRPTLDDFCMRSHDYGNEFQQ